MAPEELRASDPGAGAAESPSFIQAPSWLTFGFPGLALALLAWVELGGLDRTLFLTFNQLPLSTGPAFWAHITILGDGLVTAVLFLLWIRRHPERVWGGVLGALVMFVILRGFKTLVSLPRPLGVLPEELVTVIGPGHRRSAFPSGHTATFFLLVGVWALSTRRLWISLTVLVPGILVGCSRMAVGVHWPSDVLGGVALGWMAAWIGLRGAGRIPWGTELPGRRILAGALLISALVLLLIDHTGYPGVIWFQRGLAVASLVWGGWELRRDLSPEAPP